MIKVFIASPSDLTVERRAFKDTIDALNAGFGRGACVSFVPLGWEDALAQFGRRSQAVINRDVDDCDIFVLVMWRRWGQVAPDASPYTSYTEEEFYRAVSRRERLTPGGTTRPVIFIFFKHIDPAFMTDPGDQLKRVLAFRKQLEEKRTALYRPFTDETTFVREVQEHLIAFAEGRCDDNAEVPSLPMLPDSVRAEIDRYKGDAERAVAELKALTLERQAALDQAERDRLIAKDATARVEAAENVAEAKAAKLSAELAETAAKAALEGKLEEARQKFAKALDGTTNLRVLFLGYEFFERIGELEEAERLLRRTLSISGPEVSSRDTAGAYGNLGSIELIKGNLDAARSYYLKALGINELLGHRDGMADQYGCLGNIEQTRGNLDGAESYSKMSLAINEELGRQAGMADQYGNLGNIELTRGNLDAAESYAKRSLAIHEKLGQQDSMATDYGNLGVIEHSRGNLDAAESYFKSALAINERLGRKEGMASQFGSLGNVEMSRGALDAAEAYFKRALSVDETLGRQEGAARSLGNLGIVEHKRGNLDAAETYFKRAIGINDRLGRQEGMAHQYGNLGAVETNRGNLDAAESYYRASLAINERLGLKKGIALNNGNLGLIAKERGDKLEARRLWVLARDLFRLIGAKALERQVQDWLDKLD